MTEHEIECKAERLFDVLDRAFLRGDLSQEAYDAEVIAIDRWVTQQFSTGKVRAAS